MKESVGYTVSLNIMIVFITVIIAFLCAALIYFKSNKASNIITSEIEKYEGYNSLSISKIKRNLKTLGYGSHSITCPSTVNDKVTTEKSITCKLTDLSDGTGTHGYCVYVCYEEDNFDDGKYLGEYYYYKIRTNMMINIPIINNIMDIPIYSNTNRLYNFSK